MDIKIQDNDIVVTSTGELATTNSREEIAQIIANFFGTRQGYLYHRPYFGFDSEIITNQLAVVKPEEQQQQIADIVNDLISRYIPTLGIIKTEVNLVEDNKKAEITIVKSTNNKILAKHTIDLTLERG